MAKQQDENKIDLDNKEVPKGELLLMIQSGILFYFIYMIFNGLNYETMFSKQYNTDDQDWFQDLDNMPLAMHRQHLDNPQQQYYYLHRTLINMSDFIQFVENESTQVRAQHDFFKDAEFYKIQEIPEQEKKKFKIEIKFDRKKPQTVYNRSIVRQYLYEYIVKRFRSSRMAALAYQTRHWIVSKAVKDYILLTGKMEFTFTEVQEIIESQSILNYISDMIHTTLKQTARYKKQRKCFAYPQELLEKEVGLNCTYDDKINLDDYNLLDHFPMQEIDVFEHEFFRNRTLNLFYEKLLFFDDWNETLPIINSLSVDREEESRLDFFQNNKSQNQNQLFRIDYEKLDVSRSHKIVRSHMEASNMEHKKHQLNLQVPNIGRGMYISVEEIYTFNDKPNQYKEIGNDNFKYSNKNKQIFWYRLQKPWLDGFNQRDSALSGLPFCIFERMVTIQKNQVERVLCGSQDKDYNALQGISEQFLSKLGIQGEKYLNRKIDLAFTIQFLF